MARSGGLVCVDLGMGRLTALEVRQGTITRWAGEDLPAGALRQGDPTDPETLGLRLEQLLSRAGVESRTARLTLSDEAAVIRYVQLPSLPPRHLRRAMVYAAERELPLPLDRARWSWDVVSRGPAGVTVCLVGAWTDVVERVIAVGTWAGLKVEVVEPRSLAIARVLEMQDALLVEAWPPHLQTTLIASGKSPHVQHAAGVVDREPWDVAYGLVARQMLARDAAGGSSEMPPVLLGGQMAELSGPLLTSARDAGSALNGHPPLRPPDFPASSYLPHLGLAMRTRA